MLCTDMTISEVKSDCNPSSPQTGRYDAPPSLLLGLRYV